MIGVKFRASSCFSAGHRFRQFIPKADSIQKYQSDLVRIQIKAVGVWMLMDGRPAMLDCSNVVQIEGDVVEHSLDRYRSLSDMLRRITGDVYRIGTAYESIEQGISEFPRHYTLRGALTFIGSPESIEKL